MDGLDAVSVGEAVAAARPDAIANQMTALSVAHAGKPNLRKPGCFFATTNRLRSEGTDHLLAAAEATSVSTLSHRVSPSSMGSRRADGSRPRKTRWWWRRGRWRSATSRTWLSRQAARSCATAGSTGRAPTTIRSSSCASGVAVGGWHGYFSWVHVDDAASATVLAVEQKAKGVFNIVDDEPDTGQRVASLSRGVRRGQTAAAGRSAGRPAAGGEMMVGMMTEGRGFYNAKAKRELGWELRYPSWRQGFKEELA